MIRAYFGLAMLTGAAIFMGCGGNDGKLKVQKVVGQLKMDGKPFGPTVITLIPTSTDKKNPGRSVRGDVDGGGDIEFTSYAVGDGAPVGEYKVVVGQTFAAPPKPYPDLYSKPEKTTLTVKIEDQEVNEIEIDMDSKAGPLSKPPSFKPLDASSNSIDNPQ